MADETGSHVERAKATLRSIVPGDLYATFAMAKTLLRCCTAAAQELENNSSCLYKPYNLPAKRSFSQVDPTRLELVTSAMGRQREEFATVRLRSITPAHKQIYPKLRSPAFAVVRLGWCQVGVTSVFEHVR